VEHGPTGTTCEFCGQPLTRAPGYGHTSRCVYVVLAVAGGVTPLVVRTRQHTATVTYLTPRLGVQSDQQEERRRWPGFFGYLSPRTSSSSARSSGGWKRSARVRSTSPRRRAIQDP
jgi:hypothetical protein